MKTVARITNDAELTRAIEEFYTLAAPLEGTAAEPDAYTLALRDEIAAYQLRAGHNPAPPKTVAGLLEVEMFKRKLRQRGLAELLEVPETRLSEILRGKRGMNLDFARRLHTRLGVTAEVVLMLEDEVSKPGRVTIIHEPVVADKVVVTGRKTRKAAHGD